MLGAPAAPNTKVPFGSVGPPPAPPLTGALLAAPPLLTAPPLLGAAVAGTLLAAPPPLLVGGVVGAVVVAPRFELAQLASVTAAVRANPSPIKLDRLTLANLQVMDWPAACAADLMSKMIDAADPTVPDSLSWRQSRFEDSPQPVAAAARLICEPYA
ncbi:hypothetical protein ABIB25_004311 [Nakamurella sp. UYEF19]|uniref:hypothetical protein n=1 Tax=Nakamurella sp. UYEF19 TaxID=1756392 RepID=UPI0033937D62